MIPQEVEKEANTFQSQEERERRSAALYRIIANEVKPQSIRMKEDIPYNHHNQLLPILDTQMGVVNGQVVFHHFSKKMSSLEAVLKRSSMSMGAKMAILVQEGCKRLRNCSISLPWDTKLTHLNKFMVQIRWQRDKRDCG